MTKAKFGFCLPLFANPGMLFFRTPNYKKLDWQGILDTTIYCEKKGFDSVFVADHLFLGNEGEIWECMTTLAALAASTKKIELIPIHLCNNFRNPALTAKMIATISHISEDRFTLFYDYGWRKAEFDSHDFIFCKDDETRIEMMEEGIQIIKGMLTQKSFTFMGKYHQVKNALNTPLPKKKINLWMGETNHPRMVQSIVKNADVFNSMPCSPENFISKKKTLEKEFKVQNKDFSKLHYSFETQILIRETEEEIDQVFNSMRALGNLNNSKDDDIVKQLLEVNPKMKGYNSKEDFKDQFIIGTPETVRKRLDEFIELGVQHFMFWFMDYPERKSIDLFTDKILQYYR